MPNVKPEELESIQQFQIETKDEQSKLREQNSQTKIGEGFSERDIKLSTALTNLYEVLDKILKAQLACNKLIEQMQTGTPTEPVTVTPTSNETSTSTRL